MDAIHSIDRFDLDFSFDDAVFASDSDLAAWVRSELLVAVDEVLCDQDDGTMLVVDRLEIDLGEIDGTRGTAEVVARLRERLAMALRAARHRRRSETSNVHDLRSPGGETSWEHEMPPKPDTTADQRDPKTELERLLIQRLPEVGEQALVCADMVVSLADKFLPRTQSDNARLLSRRVLHDRFVLGNHSYAHRDAAQAMVIAFADAYPSIDRATLAAMVQRRLILPPFSEPRTRLHAPVSADPPPAAESVLVSEGLAVFRAGIVIAAPYLPRLFNMLALVKDGMFVDDGSRGRAMRLVRYAASGTDPDLDDLALERVLCGIGPDAPLPPSDPLADQDREMVDKMVGAVIQNWTALGKTSVAGLRETFLVRPGWMNNSDDFWKLRVQKGAFDMLLDKLPWGISMVKYPWMDFPMEVEWR
jgi:hypothetical protein